MKTHGHEHVAEKGGLPHLQAAFGSDVRLGAFYLGNWLTDVAQAYDPVAVTAALPKIPAIVDRFFDNVPQLFGQGKAEGEIDSYNKPLDATAQQQRFAAERVRLKADINTLITKVLTKQADNTSLYWKVAQNSFFLKGFFKFVYPDSGPIKTTPLKMDMEVYCTIFDEFYTRYWPHDHMDRSVPPLDQPNDLNLDSRVSPGPQSTGPAWPDLYAYLREYIKVISGELTEIDVTWASDYCRRARPFHKLDEDIGFNRGLARLGKALHGVEDFFAHSNYIEHAARVMGAAYIPDDYQYDNYRFLKRLKRLRANEPQANWQDIPDDDFIVTGYFDFQDTLVSLLHILEDRIMGWAGLEPKDVTRQVRQLVDYFISPEYADRVITNTADQVVHDALELISTPERARADEDNLFRQALDLAFDLADGQDFVNKVTSIRNDLAAEPIRTADLTLVIARLPLFRQLTELTGNDPNAKLKPAHMARIVYALAYFLRYMGIKETTPGLPKSLWELIRGIAKLYVLPVQTTKDWLKKKAFDQLKNYGAFFAKEQFYDYLAADRIGCHSLLGKDHGEEWLYKPMENCATAVHQYVVKTMLRWLAAPYNNRDLDDQHWVDWLELLEYFLRHPRVGVVYTVVHPIPTSYVYQLTTEDGQKEAMQLLKELARAHAPLTISSSPYDEQSILRGNVPMMFKQGLLKVNPAAVAESAVVNMVLPGLGTVLGLRRLIIPLIRYDLGVADPTLVSPKWYMPVMHPDWEPSQATTLGHALKFHASHTQASIAINVARELRNELKQRFNPQNL